MSDPTEKFDFRPTAGWKNLQLRAKMLRRLRQFFEDRGFLEVETPILSADTVIDRHLDPFYVNISPLFLGEGQAVSDVSSDQRSVASPPPSALRPPPPSNPQSLIPNPFVAGPHPNPFPKEKGTGQRMWLQTSPEFAMKRLLAVGGTAIYQIARVFRLDELGPLHNPEFTLVEWYRAGDGMEEGMALTGDLCEMMLGRGPTERISYTEAFERYVGVDPHVADGAALAEVAREHGIHSPASLSLDDRDGWLDLLMVEKIQPHLGVDQPTLLYDYPASQAALACVRLGNPPVAERFELYVAGIELANGYHELLNPAELRARNANVNAQRLADGKPALPEESRLLEAMQ
jgi:lysyl-tRNA synthetase class 2